MLRSQEFDIIKILFSRNDFQKPAHLYLTRKETKEELQNEMTWSDGIKVLYSFTFSGIFRNFLTDAKRGG